MHLERAVEYMTSVLDEDTDPLDLDRQRLIFATPWPELPDQPSDRSSNFLTPRLRDVARCAARGAANSFVLFKSRKRDD